MRSAHNVSYFMRYTLALISARFMAFDSVWLQLEYLHEALDTKLQMEANRLTFFCSGEIDSGPLAFFFLGVSVSVYSALRYPRFLFATRCVLKILLLHNPSSRLVITRVGLFVFFSPAREVTKFHFI